MIIIVRRLGPLRGRPRGGRPGGLARVPVRWYLHVHREFPGDFESTNASRDLDNHSYLVGSSGSACLEAYRRRPFPRGAAAREFCWSPRRAPPPPPQSCVRVYQLILRERLFVMSHRTILDSASCLKVGMGVEYSVWSLSMPLTSDERGSGVFFWHRLNGYFAQRVPSLFLASSSRMCLNREVLKGMFPWRTRQPSS